MAATGYTPISLYYSTTASAVPVNTNLTNGELAINITDGKLYFKNNSGVVTLLAGAGGAGIVAGSNTQLQFNSSGVFGASANLTWDGTSLTSTNSVTTGGHYSKGASTATFTDGIVVDYATGLGRISVGTGDGFAWYTGGVGTTSLMALSSAGSLNLNSSASSGTLVLNAISNTRYSDFNTTSAGYGFSSYSYSGTAYGYLGQSSAIFGGSNTDFAVDAVNNLLFGTGNTERMRLDSSGNLGLGTSSPAYKLDVNGSAQVSGSSPAFYVNNGTINYRVIPTSGAAYTGTISNHPIIFQTNNTAQATLDTSGNLGLGVTPSAWSGLKAIQLSNNSSAGIGIYGAGLNEFGAVSNTYYNGTNWIYSTTATSARYAISGGQHQWYNAASGTAGNAITFTQAMTLDASGNLGVGGTSSGARLWLQTASGNCQIQLNNGSYTNTVQTYGSSYGAAAAGDLLLYNNAGNSITLMSDNASGTIKFATGAGGTERMRIDSSGNVGIGTSSPSKKLDVNGDASINGLTVGKGASAVASNTAFGSSALAANTSGFENVAIGAISMNANTTGTYNTATGRASLYSNTTGSNNSAFGDGALQSNTTASNNTAVGYQAGYTNTTGANNTIFGYQAGYSNSTGNYNAIFGDTAGYSITSTGNTAIGHGALNNGGGSAGYNTCIGYGAGYVLSTGTKNTIIGAYQGNSGGLDIRTASNYIVLSDGDGNPRGIFDGSGNFLVGTTQAATGTPTQGVQILNNSGQTNLEIGHITGSPSGTEYLGFSYNGSKIGSITQSGTTAVLYNLTSDRRIKENIVDAPDASADIDAIKVRSFDFISDKSPVKYGFIAQELVTVAPDAVHQPKDPEEMMGVDYSKLVPMMLKEIQSLRARLKAANIA